MIYIPVFLWITGIFYEFVVCLFQIKYNKTTIILTIESAINHDTIIKGEIYDKIMALL